MDKHYEFNNGNNSYNTNASPQMQKEIDFNVDNLLRQFLQSARKGDKEQFLELLDKLVAHNTSLINFQDEQGQTALHYAADEGNLKIVEILIKSNCNLNMRSNIKRTALHISCLHGYFDISKLLIENGALINVQDNERNTPIHLCVVANHIELLKYLLERCPQADVKNIYNKTPSDLSNNADIKSMLSEYLSKNESKYHKIKIHNVNTNMAISMLTGMQKHSSNSVFNTANANVNTVSSNCGSGGVNNIKPTSIKGVLFSSNTSTKKNIHTHSTNYNVINQKLRKFHSNLHSSTANTHHCNTTNTNSNNTHSHNINNQHHHTNITNNNNNNININISANMCNVLNLSGQKSKKLFSTASSTSNNNNNNNNTNNNTNNKTNIAIEAKIASPKLRKSISKQIFHNKRYSASKGFNTPNTVNYINNKHLTTNTHFGMNTPHLSNQFLSPEKKIAQTSNYISTSNTLFTKAKSKPNFFSSQSKRKFKTESKPQTAQTPSQQGATPTNASNIKSAMKLVTVNNFFTHNNTKQIFSSRQPKAKNTIVIKKKANAIATTTSISSTKQTPKHNAHMHIHHVHNHNRDNNNKLNEVKNVMNSLNTMTSSNQKQNKIQNVEINLNDESTNSNNSFLNSTTNENNTTNTNNNNDNENASLSYSQENQNEEKISLEMFICHSLLGKGSFGSVYLVEKKSTHKLYAMKVLNKSLIMNQNIVKYAMTERNVLSITSHPFIVKLNYAFQTPDKLFLILDYCPGGDLAEHLSKEKRFKEHRAKIYLCEIILAIGDLHKHDIIFRDLKPDNVVLDSKGHALLTDFGLSKEGVYDGNMAKSFCGSIAYLAPEMLKRKGHGKAVDWYLLGVLFYEMLVGIPPYFTDNQELIFRNIEKGDLQIPKFVSDKAAALLRALLQKDPEKRLGFKGDVDEIKSHEYFKGVNWKDVYDKKLMPPVIGVNKKKEGEKKKLKGVDIEKILKDENQIDCDLSESNFDEEGGNADGERGGLFSGWTFIQNDLVNENNNNSNNNNKS